MNINLKKNKTIPKLQQKEDVWVLLGASEASEQRMNQWLWRTYKRLTVRYFFSKLLTNHVFLWSDLLIYTGVFPGPSLSLCCVTKRLGCYIWILTFSVKMAKEIGFLIFPSTFHADFSALLGEHKLCTVVIHSYMTAEGRGMQFDNSSRRREGFKPPCWKSALFLRSSERNTELLLAYRK